MQPENFEPKNLAKFIQILQGRLLIRGVTVLCCICAAAVWLQTVNCKLQTELSQLRFYFFS